MDFYKVCAIIVKNEYELSSFPKSSQYFRSMELLNNLVIWDSFPSWQNIWEWIGSTFLIEAIHVSLLVKRTLYFQYKGDKSFSRFPNFRGEVRTINSISLYRTGSSTRIFIASIKILNSVAFSPCRMFTSSKREAFKVKSRFPIKGRKSWKIWQVS